MEIEFGIISTMINIQNRFVEIDWNHIHGNRSWSHIKIDKYPKHIIVDKRPKDINVDRLESYLWK